jgi:TM2 domain-containing membrane protein YozV
LIRVFCILLFEGDGTLQPEVCSVPTESRRNSSADTSTALAILLSVLVPGLGHIYLARRRRGIGLILLWMLGWILVLLTIGYVIVPLVWFVAVVDTIRISSTI